MTLSSDITQAVAKRFVDDFFRALGFVILRCRTCGKDNHVADLAESYVCEWCGASFTLNTAKVIEREPPKPSDPLGDFR